MKYYLKVLKNYANFSGRASRSEYWYFVLFNIIIAFTLAFIDGLLGEIIGSSYPFFYIIYLVGIIIPSLAVLVRRLHDIDKSGTWIFIYLVPLIGGIWLLILLATESHFGKNKYGNHPDQEVDDLHPDILDSKEFFTEGTLETKNLKESSIKPTSGQSSFSKGAYSRSRK